MEELGLVLFLNDGALRVLHKLRLVKTDCMFRGCALCSRSWRNGFLLLSSIYGDGHESLTG